jgi:hypothetical protein
VNQYSIKFEPELSSDNYSLRKKILWTISPNLRQQFEPYIISGDNLYTAKGSIESVEFGALIQDEMDLEYKVSITKTSNEIEL